MKCWKTGTCISGLDMTERVEEIDGYKVRLQRSQNGDYPRYHAEARDDLWGRYAEVFAEDAYDALSKLADRANLNRDEVLITFGIEP